MADGSWTDKAACKGAPVEVFYPADSDVDGQVTAKRMCFSCPVRDACLEEAMRLNDRYGVFGGLTRKERQSLRPADAFG